MGTSRDMKVEFKDLIGLATLDAVDRDGESVKQWDDRYEDCSLLRFRLSGVMYVALEDPDDGYRSAMAGLFLDTTSVMKNVFAPILVLVRESTDQNRDTLEILDTRNGKLIIEIGTDISDTYYPVFVASFNPENIHEV